ncbi:hypothetical protein TRIP_B330683 [uncultured Desulfatiglans sp.]|nr:hypothetical protein TRIP_B330683 [uncultured Desulfatiglans sp.]
MIAPSGIDYGMLRFLTLKKDSHYVRHPGNHARHKLADRAGAAGFHEPESGGSLRPSSEAR